MRLDGGKYRRFVKKGNPTKGLTGSQVEASAKGFSWVERGGQFTEVV